MMCYLKQHLIPIGAFRNPYAGLLFTAMHHRVNLIEGHPDFNLALIPAENRTAVAFKKINAAPVGKRIVFLD